MNLVAPETKMYVLYVRGFLVMNYDDVNTLLLMKIQLTIHFLWQQFFFKLGQILT